MAYMATVHVFKDGYASHNKGQFEIEATASDAEISKKARELFNNWSIIDRVARPFVGPREHFSPEYIRQMSIGG